jgi:hypothetical protein
MDHNVTVSSTTCHPESLSASRIAAAWRITASAVDDAVTCWVTITDTTTSPPFGRVRHGAARDRHRQHRRRVRPDADADVVHPVSLRAHRRRQAAGSQPVAG